MNLHEHRPINDANTGVAPAGTTAPDDAPPEAPVYATPPGIAGTGPVPASRRHAIAELRVQRFRNYPALTVRLDAAPVVLHGDNGAGKTNLLEAVSMLAPGRGLRGAALAELAHQPPSAGADPAPSDHAPEGAATAAAGTWAVAARIAVPSGAGDATATMAVGTGVTAATGDTRTRRAVHVDGEAVGQPALAHHVRLVWMTPDMDRLFQDSPGARRRFLDRLVAGFNPDHPRHIAAYERAMRERARLLKSGSRDDIWLRALEQRMAEHGIAITADRRATVARLAAAPHPPPPFPAAAMSLIGGLSGWLADGPALAAEDRLLAALAQSRDHDALVGGAAHGPHRDDLHVVHVGHDAPAARCSTGEQKALVIAILIAFSHLQALQHGTAPIVLLDEVAAHLDGERRAVLFEALLDLGAQAWLTGTDAALFAPLSGKAQFFHVAHAALSEPPAHAKYPLMSNVRS